MRLRSASQAVWEKDERDRGRRTPRIRLSNKLRRLLPIQKLELIFQSNYDPEQQSPFPSSQPHPRERRLDVEQPQRRTIANLIRVVQEHHPAYVSVQSFLYLHTEDSLAHYPHDHHCRR